MNSQPFREGCSFREPLDPHSASPYTLLLVSHSASSNYSPFPEHSVPWPVHVLGSDVLITSSSTPLFGLSFQAALGDLFCQVLLTTSLPPNPHGSTTPAGPFQLSTPTSLPALYPPAKGCPWHQARHLACM